MRKLLLGLMLLASPVLANENYEKLAEEVTPKVVHITVTGLGEFYTLFSSTPIISSATITGSGSFVSPTGHILTCNHLFDNELKYPEIRMRTSDGHYYRAWVLAQDSAKDLALLKVFPLNPVPYLKRDGVAKTGQQVFAFGSPLGLRNSMTSGFISNPEWKEKKLRRIIHTAPTNPGNSGGPLVDSNGRLIGIIRGQLVAGMFQMAEGMHVAVGIKDIKSFLGEAKNK